LFILTFANIVNIAPLLTTVGIIHYQFTPHTSTQANGRTGIMIEQIAEEAIKLSPHYPEMIFHHVTQMMLDDTASLVQPRSSYSHKRILLTLILCTTLTLSHQPSGQHPGPRALQQVFPTTAHTPGELGNRTIPPPGR
jgi:hypothetical protein